MNKCAPYFPSEVNEVVAGPSRGGIEVRNLATARDGDLVVRRLRVSGSVGGQQRTADMQHFHYTTW